MSAPTQTRRPANGTSIPGPETRGGDLNTPQARTATEPTPTALVGPIFYQANEPPSPIPATPGDTIKARRPAKMDSFTISQPRGGDTNTQQANQIAESVGITLVEAASHPAICDPKPAAYSPGGSNNAASPATTVSVVAGETDPQTTNRQFVVETHCVRAVGDVVVPGRTGFTLYDQALSMAAEIVDDLEATRTANENRLRHFTRTEPDHDGLETGLGLTADHPDVIRQQALVDALTDLETQAVKGLQQQLRRHPLAPWVKSMKGVGDKQAARLLAAIGDPYLRPTIHRPDGTILPAGPRTVSQLWAYCGWHVVDHDGEPGAARRTRGQKANWSNTAKTRSWVIAASCIKQIGPSCRTPPGQATTHGEQCSCSPYRVVYDQRRAHTGVVHPEWSDLHAHKDAMRVMSKSILRDLWIESKRLHETHQS